MAFSFIWQEIGRPLHISLQGGALTLSFDGTVNVSFDGEGRPAGAFWAGMTYRRALDNRVLAKWFDAAQRRRRRRFLDDAERRAVLERAAGLAAEVVAGLYDGRLAPSSPAPIAAIGDWLQRAVAWDWTRLEGERARFLSVYKPVPILPPDQYLSIVVQATECCSYNECSFCTFYRDRPFRVKTQAALLAHLDAVQAFLGRGQAMRKGVFLADANAMVVAQRRLLPMLDAIDDRFGQVSNGLYAFISAPDALNKRPSDFAELRAHHLRRVYMGLETGHDPLRRLLRKPGSAADARVAVERIKAGGVAVGLIVMAGVGGERYQAAHCRDTVAVLQQMPLSAGDIVYISPFVVDPLSPYAGDMAGMAPLDEAEIDREIAGLRMALKSWAGVHGVRVSTYDIREFVY